MSTTSNSSEDFPHCLNTVFFLTFYIDVQMYLEKLDHEVLEMSIVGSCYYLWIQSFEINKCHFLFYTLIFHFDGKTIDIGASFLVLV